jgi:phosphoglycerate dehydrogenase-like enzyme
MGILVRISRGDPPYTPGVLTTDQWRERLGEFDWVVIVVPSTPDTAKMIGAAELAAMKSSASILNFARGAVIDTDALVEALQNRTIAGAWLDVTDPEPLPGDHPLWSLDNCHISMHLSGRSQTLLFQRAAERFLVNLEKYRRGETLDYEVDLKLGY